MVQLAKDSADTSPASLFLPFQTWLWGVSIPGFAPPRSSDAFLHSCKQLSSWVRPPSMESVMPWGLVHSCKGNISGSPVPMFGLCLANSNVCVCETKVKDFSLQPFHYLCLCFIVSSKCGWVGGEQSKQAFAFISLCLVQTPFPNKGKSSDMLPWCIIIRGDGMVEHLLTHLLTCKSWFNVTFLVLLMAPVPLPCWISEVVFLTDSTCCFLITSNP